MPLIDLLVLGLVIGSNNLAAALALGALGQAARRCRITLVFGAFEFFVPLVGIALGAAMARSLGLQTSLVGAVLLVALGLIAIVGGIRNRSADERLARVATNWRGLVMVAAGLSVDNLVVGFSLGLGQADPLLVASTIAFFSVLFTWVGIGLGDMSRRHWERRAKLASGVLLLGLGVANAVGWL